jgi:hypothetical protein
VRERAGHGRDVDDTALDVEVPHVGVEVGEAAAQRIAIEGLGRQAEAGQRLEAELPVRAGEIRGDGPLGDVQTAAADEHLRAGPALEVAPQMDGLLREAGVGRVEVVAAVRPRAAVRRGHRVSDAPALEDDDARRPLRGVIGGEQAHHTAADDHEIVQSRQPVQ